MGTTRALTYPSKLNYNIVLQRFRVLAGLSYWNYSVININDKAHYSEKDDVQCLLDSIFYDKTLSDLLIAASISTDSNDSDDSSTDKNNSNNNDNDDNYYVLGKTLVYFRPGILEYLETELLAIFDKCVIKIQQWYKRCKERQKSPNKNSDAKLLTWMEANKTQLNIIFISIFKIFAHQSEFAHQKEEKKIRTKGRIQSVANDTNALASRRRSKSSPSIN